MSDYRLEMRGVVKTFPGVKALDHAQLKLRPGTVHALMGENGAGKSTLMKCMFGIYHMDEGEMLYEGEPVKINGPLDALNKGIAMVHQELQPIPERSIGENIYVGRYPVKRFGPVVTIDHEKMYEDAAKVLQEVHLDFNLKAKLGSLSVSQMQLVEIAKAVSADFIITKMVGRELSNLYPQRQNVPGEVVFEVEDFTSINPKSFRHVSFNVRRGEILGVAGLVGAQRTELMEGLFGLRCHNAGKITYKGRELKINQPKQAIDNGIAMLTEDRRATGILGALSIASLKQYLIGGIVLDDKKIEQLVQDNVAKLSIKTPSSKTLIQSLSGGNQQKVLISRWLANGMDALELAEQLRPDVVLTDIKMPYMDGPELCRRLRQLLPASKMVVFSGFDDFEYARQAVGMNVYEYILKPINAPELGDVLGRLRAQLDKERLERRDMEALRRRYEDSLPILRELFFTRLLERGCDVLFVNIVDRTAASVIVDKAQEAGAPLIFFNRQPVAEDINYRDQVYYVGASAEESGRLQGELVAQAWKNESGLDRNGDGVIQYVMLEGEPGHQDSLLRTEYSIKAVTEAGIEVEKLANAPANWNRGQGAARMSQWLREYGRDIEVVFSNNDDMALGAIDAIREWGGTVWRRPPRTRSGRRPGRNDR